MPFCLNFGRSNKVSPQSEFSEDYRLENIREGRRLGIKHVNRRSRPRTIREDEPLLNIGEIGKYNISLAAAENVVIFFIHGVGGSSDIWKSQIDYFSNLNYEVVVPDLIGHGFSDAPKDQRFYHFDEISKDILEIFDSRCSTWNVVVGHSYGCCFTAVLARQRPHLVSRLILISGGGPTPLAPQTGIFSLPTPVLTCCQPILNRIFNKFAYDDPLLAERRPAFDVPTYVLRNTMRGQLWLVGGVSYHKKISCPALIIHGAADKLVKIEEEEEMKEVIPYSTLAVLQNAGHMVMMERPKEVNERILQFITS